MLNFKTLRAVMPSFVLGVALSSMSFHAQAKRPGSITDSTTGSQCLTGKEFNWLAKSYLAELQLIDPSVTLTDIKTVLNSAGNCATLDDYSLAIQQYSDSLSNSETIASTDPVVTEPVITNQAPVISGTATSTITQGQFYLFTPMASDPDGDALIYSVQNLPSWAQFDSTTGSILGVPMAADIGIYQNIVISVSDGMTSTSLTGINLEVTGLQVVGQANPLLTEIAGYTIFVGTVQSDLSKVINLDVGAAPNIQANNTLSAESTYYLGIVARDVNGNSIVLSNSEIAGFRIYIGTAEDNLTPVTNFTDVEKVYWVNQLIAGTYFVSLSTYDNNGNETPLSNIVKFDLI